tara:strand:- start:615 stop:1238 length:624 start_codon:yes stop_codon:yes gene_type:complete
MAITDGLAIACGDLQATGGIKRVLIREWNSTGSVDDIIFGALGVHTITSIQDSSGTTSTWGVFENKIETPALVVSGTTDKNVSTYECSVSFNLPKMDLTKTNRLQEFTGKCLMVLAEDTNADWFVLGISDTLTGSDGNLDPNTAGDSGTRQQTFAKLGSIEGGSGAAFSDENGLTVTLTCTQFELPRLYVNATAFVYAADGLTATVV